jgi:peroxiredoxin (alkyl hydroperoxide reductase subunit C)
MGILVGKKAPDFKAKAVINGKIVNDFSLSQFHGKHVILFFYPLDFTFVCPTELHAFQDSLEDFEKRNTVIIGCSVDSCYSHYAWLNTPKEKGGIEGIHYPLIADLSKTIASDYDVLMAQEGIAYRGLFLIDREGIVRHQVVNDLPLGRSIDEALRILDALLYFELHGEVCPANWQTGKPTFKASYEELHKYFIQKSQTQNCS